MNQELRAEAATRNVERIGSTVVVLLACDNHCRYLWAGDSRIYLYRSGRLKLLTRDHSVLQELKSRGHLVSGDVLPGPAQHGITRAVGAADILHLDEGIEEVIVPVAVQVPASCSAGVEDAEYDAEDDPEAPIPEDADGDAAAHPLTASNRAVPASARPSCLFALSDQPRLPACHDPLPGLYNSAEVEPGGSNTVLLPPATSTVPSARNAAV